LPVWQHSKKWKISTSEGLHGMTPRKQAWVRMLAQVAIETHMNARNKAWVWISCPRQTTPTGHQANKQRTSTASTRYV
jgi:hypothetical protein